ncbi:MAG: enoyl-CoA hydratase-related protein [Motiliproteus sp.]
MNIPDYQTLNCKLHHQHLEIRLNRPHRLNAVVEQLYQELLHVLGIARMETAIRAIVLTGEGRAFCVGADLKEHSTGNRTLLQKRQYLQLANDVCEQIFNHPKPIIAAVNGYALGAGAEIALACDFIVIAETAEIGFPEASIGTCVGGGISQTLPRLVGLAKARELLLSSQRINGQQAQEIGLASRVASDSQLLEEASSLAQQLASNAPLSMALTKQLLNKGHNQSLDTCLQLELDGIATCMASKDWQEGIDAFAEKRAPLFNGS